MVSEPTFIAYFSLQVQLVLLQASAALKRVIPLFDRVLVERFAAETKTKGGLHLPEKSLGKVLNATVVAVGKGLKQKVD